METAHVALDAAKLGAISCDANEHGIAYGLKCNYYGTENAGLCFRSLQSANMSILSNTPYVLSAIAAFADAGSFSSSSIPAIAVSTPCNQYLTAMQNFGMSDGGEWRTQPCSAETLEAT